MTAAVSVMRCALFLACVLQAAVPARAVSFDCVSSQERIRDLLKDIEQDAQEYGKVKSEVAKARSGFLNPTQASALAQKDNYIQYIRKQVPSNAAQLRVETNRAKRYQCVDPAELDEIELRSARAAELVAAR
jgi:hypothetical protein